MELTTRGDFQPVDRRLGSERRLQLYKIGGVMKILFVLASFFTLLLGTGAFAAAPSTDEYCVGAGNLYVDFSVYDFSAGCSPGSPDGKAVYASQSAYAPGFAKKKRAELQRSVLDRMEKDGFRVIDRLGGLVVLKKTANASDGPGQQICIEAHGAQVGCSAGVVLNTEGTLNQTFDSVLLQNGFKEVAEIKKSPFHQDDLQIFIR
jgi:hypothetical protein